jgi:UDP-glucose 4-epimerase
MAPDPQSPYAVTKLAAEHYCQVFERIYGLNTVCLRYFNVYGPRQDPDSPYAAVIPLFINNALTGKPLVIFGDGNQTRDFTFVKDVVIANIMAAESPAYGVFNIGSGTRVTINDVAQLIIKIVGNSRIKIEYRDVRPGDILHSLADITRSGEFGYRPRYSLEEGLREVVDSLRPPGR